MQPTLALLIKRISAQKLVFLVNSQEILLPTNIEESVLFYFPPSIPTPYLAIWELADSLGFRLLLVFLQPQEMEIWKPFLFLYPGGFLII